MWTSFHPDSAPAPGLIVQSVEAEPSTQVQELVHITVCLYLPAFSAGPHLQACLPPWGELDRLPHPAGLLVAEAKQRHSGFCRTLVPHCFGLPLFRGN